MIYGIVCIKFEIKTITVGFKGTFFLLKIMVILINEGHIFYIFYLLHITYFGGNVSFYYKNLLLKISILVRKQLFLCVQH